MVENDQVALPHLGVQPDITSFPHIRPSHEKTPARNLARVKKLMCLFIFGLDQIGL